MNTSTELNVEMPGLSVSLDRSLSVALLRHLAAGAGFAGDIIGAPLPERLQAVAVASGILAWRSPTETLVVSQDAGRFAALEAGLVGRTDVSFVDQTGGIWIWRITGERASEVLARLGATSAIPAVGQALTSRLAELTVMALCMRAGEILLLVDRVYSAHLMGWVRETVADF
jgi:sarcosine oxidase gamma subunit